MSRYNYSGDDYWYTWSLYFPEDYKTISPAENCTGQFHEGKSNKTALMIIERDGYILKMTISRTQGTHIWSMHRETSLKTYTRFGFEVCGKAECMSSDIITMSLKN